MPRVAATAALLTLGALGVVLLLVALLAGPNFAERHVLPDACATGPAEWVLASGARLLTGALGVGMLAAAPVAARRLGRSARVRPGSLGGVALALVAALAVAEGFLRHLHARLALGGPPPSGRAIPMTRVDPRLGWSYVPRRTTWVESAGRRVAYAIDAEGNRSSSPDATTDPEKPTILVAGESIAFGYGLPFEETFPFLVGRALAVQIVNLSVVGYGSDQAWSRVADALPRYRRPVAVVTLFVPDQLRRATDSWRSRLGLGPHGELVTLPPAEGLRLTKLLEVLPWHGDERLRVTGAVLRATAEAARARGAIPLFVVTNYGPPCMRDANGGEAWVVNELFVRHGLPFVRVDLDPADRLPGILERHPSLRGTRKLADAVVRALSDALNRAPPSPRAETPTTKESP